MDHITNDYDLIQYIIDSVVDVVFFVGIALYLYFMMRPGKDE